ncbi:hypothetical protein ACFW9L_16405, partial [Streptomyces sp. NPDC059517]
MPAHPQGDHQGPNVLLRHLTTAMCGLHEAAGAPSFRKISEGIRSDSALRATASHQTVSDILRGKRLTKWDTLHCVVVQLVRMDDRDENSASATVQTTCARIMDLWAAAKKSALPTAGLAHADTPDVPESAVNRQTGLSSPSGARITGAARDTSDILLPNDPSPSAISADGAVVPSSRESEFLAVPLAMTRQPPGQAAQHAAPHEAARLSQELRQTRERADRQALQTRDLQRQLSELEEEYERVHADALQEVNCVLKQKQTLTAELAAARQKVTDARAAAVAAGVKADALALDCGAFSRAAQVAGRELVEAREHADRLQRHLEAERIQHGQQHEVAHTERVRLTATVQTLRAELAAARQEAMDARAAAVAAGVKADALALDCGAFSRAAQVAGR